MLYLFLGTGKTTIARKFGQVYYDMGFLSSSDLIECSASDLVGQYVGHTGPKTKKLFEKALGKVLFVDEAYRLSNGHFAQEAIDELVGLMTNEKFMNKMVIVLAGYEKEMNALLSVNPGLASRFSEEITLTNMTAAKCLQVLDKELQKMQIVLSELADSTSSAYSEMETIIDVCRTGGTPETSRPLPRDSPITHSALWQMLLRIPHHSPQTRR